MQKQSPETLFKKIPWQSCFPVIFAKFLRTPYRTPLVAASVNTTANTALRKLQKLHPISWCGNLVKKRQCPH